MSNVQQLATDWTNQTIDNLQSYLANVPCTMVQEIHRSAYEFSSLIVKLNDVIGSNAIITGFLSKVYKEMRQGKLNLAFSKNRARLLNNIGTTMVNQVCLLSLSRRHVGFEFDYYQLRFTSDGSLDNNIVLENSDDE